MKFRAKLQMKMETADQPGAVMLNFVPVEAGVPQLNLTVSPADAAGMKVGQIYSFGAEVEHEQETT